MTPDERRDRWMEARVASSAYRAIAAATGRSWEAVAEIATELRPAEFAVLRELAKGRQR